MDNLLELLNEYEKEKKSGYTWKSIDSYDNCIYGVDCDGETEITMYSDLYSKYYGFIKHLVENDKIDFDKMEEKSEYIFIKNGGGEHIIEDLLMILSISDTPIEDLISYLQ